MRNWSVVLSLVGLLTVSQVFADVLGFVSIPDGVVPGNSYKIEWFNTNDEVSDIVCDSGAASTRNV